MTKLSELRESIVKAGQPLEGPGASVRDEVGEQLMARLGLPPLGAPPAPGHAPPATGAPTPPTAAGPVHAAGVSLGAKVLAAGAKIGLVVTLMGGAAAVYVKTRDAHGPVRSAPADSAHARERSAVAAHVAPRAIAARVTVAPITAPVTVPVADEPAAAPSIGATPPRSLTQGRAAESHERAGESHPPPASDSFVEQASGLRAAQAALRNHQPGSALTLLDEQARRYPRGLFVAEVTVSRIRALCELGRVAEARTLGESFLPPHAPSVYTDRVRASCAGSRE